MYQFLIISTYMGTLGTIMFHYEKPRNSCFFFRNRGKFLLLGSIGLVILLEKVETFKKVDEMSDAIANLKECSISEEYLTNKNVLIDKCNQFINEMSLTTIENEVSYYTGLCIM